MEAQADYILGSKFILSNSAIKTAEGPQSRRGSVLITWFYRLAEGFIDVRAVQWAVGCVGSGLPSLWLPGVRL